MNTIIEVTLKENRDYESKFNEEVLSKDLADYILSECEGVDAKSDYTLRVYPEFEVTEADQDRFSDMVHDYFNSEVREIKYASQKTFKVDIVFLIIGILAVIGYIITKASSEISSELILVLGWVFLWEGFDNLTLSKVKTRPELKRKSQLARCTISFKSLD